MPASDITIAMAGGAGVASGALLTVAASLWGQRREARREQGRWLRDQRIEAYMEFERATGDLVALWHAHDRVAKRLAGNDASPMQKPKPAPDPLPVQTALNVARSRIAMVGTPEVQKAGNVVSNVAFFCYDHEIEPPGSIVAPFEAAARDALMPRTAWSRLTRRGRPNVDGMLEALTREVELAHGPVCAPKRWPRNGPTEGPSHD